MRKNLRSEEVQAVIAEARSTLTQLLGRPVVVQVHFQKPLSHLEPEYILDQVCLQLETTPVALTSENRHRPLVEIRHSLLYFMRRLTDWNDEKLASMVNRERTAVINAEACVKNLLLAGDVGFTHRHSQVATVLNRLAEQEAVSE